MQTITGYSAAPAPPQLGDLATSENTGKTSVPGSKRTYRPDLHVYALQCDVRHCVIILLVSAQQHAATSRWTPGLLMSMFAFTSQI